MYGSRSSRQDNVHTYKFMLFVDHLYVFTYALSYIFTYLATQYDYLVIFITLTGDDDC